MEVPRSYIDGYDQTMRSAIEGVQNELRAALSLVDYSKPIEAVRVEVAGLMDAYCDAASSIGARISAEFYSGLREIASGKGGILSLQTGRNRQATERAVRAFIDQLIDGSDEVFEELLMERVELEAKKAAAYNTIDNVRNDPDRPRFARVPIGEKTCDFCLMLASRGPVYLTEESAGAFTKFHAHCDCKVVPFWGTVGAGVSRRKGSMTVEGYDPDAYYKEYRERMKDPAFAARMKQAASTAKDRAKERQRTSRR